MTRQVHKTDEDYMRQALALGRFGLGNTAPNPAVGCVLVKDARIIGGGFTQKSGRPHAEAMALDEAGKDAQGATAYVTLEPCAHTGQTPPCAASLKEAGVARVVYAIDDPDPRVNGGGATMLRDAGIEVERGLLASEARRDQLGFLLSKTDSRPMVTLKLAVSANGFIRTPEGKAPWITGALARNMGHLLRARHDAIMTGSGTVKADDPSLDCRLPGLADASPVPVVMTNGDLPTNRKLAQRENLIVTHAAPRDVLTNLAARGITRVLLESGPTLAAAFLADDVVDEIALFTAPHEVAMTGESDISQMQLGLARFSKTHAAMLGPDSYVHYCRERKN
ncbi:MAG: bifunctional diaminohydroxyphosphoribosylaminopyrimidine deaminase/5-amino-6-(5-phosphoribosylamino)uracil reductase RibD [Alphaproteobacteria bacterium]|nr:bifunctional diaminohydroxyphosphoribosylaminopyrimidine deaminase/5-amino-6-(5-phosphoribosylamino)uracil reductase RibD [Alphaproteobacteria bacterium]